MTQKNKIVKMSILPKLISRLTAMTIKIPTGSLEILTKADSKSCMYIQMT